MTWGTPIAFALLLLVPAVAYVRRRLRGRGAARAAPASLVGASRRYASLRSLTAGAAWPLRALTLGALVGALARPQGGFEESHDRYVGVDVMVAVDCSASMLAEDIAPNRMEAAKSVVRRFVEGLGQDRCGLVVFCGEALTYCPLTTDLAALADMTDQMQVEMVAPGGTNIEAALLSAAARFEEDDGRTHVAIVVTDGEQTVPGEPVGVGARACAAKGIRVYTIGVGSPEGAFIPMPRGGFAADQFGRPVRTRMDENTLREIARLTQGRYFRAETAGELREVFEEISALEKGAIEVDRRVLYEERMWMLAAPALALILLDAALLGVYARRALR